MSKKSQDSLLAALNKSNPNKLSQKGWENWRNILESMEDFQDIWNTRNETKNNFSSTIPKAGGPAVAIVVGHTAKSVGACGVLPIDNCEYWWNRDLAEKIVTEIKSLGAESRIFYRDLGGIKGAYNRVNNWGATAAIELHYNAFDGSVQGTETLWGHSSGKKWARILQDKMVSIYGRSGKQNRGLKDRSRGGRGHASVTALKIPIALIEPFFGDNEQDSTMAQELKPELAKCVAEVCANWVFTS